MTNQRQRPERLRCVAGDVAQKLTPRVQTGVQGVYPNLGQGSGHVIWDRSARRASLSLTNTRPFLMFNQSCAAIGVVCAAVGGVVAVIHVVEV
jgi:hypothetical protein